MTSGSKEKSDRALRELATLFKERENCSPLGVITGTVLANPPDIQIKIFGSVVLTKENLIFGSLVMSEEKRNFEIVEGDKDGAGASEGVDELSKVNIDTDDGTFSGETNKSSTGVTNASESLPPTVACSFAGMHPPIVTNDPTHDHTLKKWATSDNKFTGKGTIVFKNTLKVDDEVILLPTMDAQTFFVLDWVRRIA